MSRISPCITPRGPKNAKILFCGEAPGEQEEMTGMPFIGSSGQELEDMCGEVGIHFRRDCWITNVLLTRPPNNKIGEFCVSKKDLPAGYSLPPLSQGQYLHPEFLPELDRLYAEVESVKPNIIIALGNTPLWAFTGSYGITALRGAVQHTKWGKLLPTYHPSYILRDWGKRTIALADLAKALYESDFPEIRRPERWVLVDPTFPEVMEWLDIAEKVGKISIDVETKGRQITVIGFAYSPSELICIPFYDSRKPYQGYSYWPKEEEVAIRLRIQRLLACPNIKIFQNGLYDIQYLLREGFRPNLSSMEDTMLQHHALYPEMPKSLGFLGSIYTNEASWKILRRRKSDSNKREDS